MNSFLDLPRLREGFRENLGQGDFIGLLGNTLQAIRDESGVDDYVRFGRHLGQGNFLSALKSLGTGVAETVSLAATGGGRSLLTAGAKRALPFIGTRTGGSLAKFLVPLSKEEQVIARAVRQSGVGRRLFNAADDVRPMGRLQLPGLEDAGSIITRARRLPFYKRLPEGTQRVLNRRILPGYGRGGITGSFARGAGQLFGYLPLNAPEVRFLQNPIGRYLTQYAPMVGARSGFSVTGAPFAALMDELLSGGIRVEDLPEDTLRVLTSVLQDSAESGKPLEYYENLRMRG